jgi:hypothetical protein
MILRIAWANYPRDVGLAIAANIFTYAGTIILYMVDWFFAQRIIRAQHPSLGWSTQYRIFHRGGLVLLVVTLLGLIVSQVWKFFTLNHVKQDAFQVLFLVAQTYATAFCFAPAILVTLSLLIPRTEVEKFGAGRLRYNITILLISVCILSTGQVFRCVLAWIPPTRMTDVQRGDVQLPWYLSKACFYCFNFLTEILVVMLFAIARVDLRFYVPNGARKEGDYSRSRLDLHDEDDINPHNVFLLKNHITHPHDSNQTLHRYQSSVFEDTQTLADSLRYPHSTLEVDEKTGNWKVKRVSTESTRSRHTAMLAPIPPLYSSSSRSTLNTSPSRNTVNDRNFRTNSNTPPVPELPAEWPLADAVPPKGTSPVLEHPNAPPHKVASRQQTFELENHELNNFDVGDAVTDALAKLEMNSDRKKAKAPITPPLAHYRSKTPIPAYKPASAMKSSNGRSSTKKSVKYTINTPPDDSLRSRVSSTPLSPPRYSAPSYDHLPELPKKHQATRSVSASYQRSQLSSSPSLEIISLLNTMSNDQSRIIDASLLREPVTSPTLLERSPVIAKTSRTHQHITNPSNPSNRNFRTSTTIPIPTTTFTPPAPPAYPKSTNASITHPSAAPFSPSSATTTSSTQEEEDDNDDNDNDDDGYRPHTQTSSDYSHEYSPSSVDTQEKAWAEDEFRKFSSEPTRLESEAERVAAAARQVERARAKAGGQYRRRF